MQVIIFCARDHSIADGLDYLATWRTGIFNPEPNAVESLKAKAQKRDAKFADLLPVRKMFGPQP
jgi:enoyl-CoA hydratase